MPHKNREARNAWVRQWRAKNAERLAPQVREQVRRWRAANLERSREIARDSKRRWREANPELSRKLSAEAAARSQADPIKREQGNEYRREWKRKWRRDHPELVREEARRRHLRIQNDPILREKRNALMRKRYHGSAKTKWREGRKRWLAENPEKWAAQQKRRKERKPWLRALIKARVRSRANGLENILTNSWAEARYTGKCELTGIAFVINSKPNPYSISLDRIDSSKGYTPHNCRFILWALNRFKNEDSDAEMIAIARALVAAADQC